MKRPSTKNTELFFAASALYFGEVLLLSGPLDASVRGSLVGALVGVAAVLLITWLSRTHERLRGLEQREERRTSLKVLVAAELLDVAIGLRAAKALCLAAVRTAEGGGRLREHEDFSSYMPRPLPFVEGAGVELLVLEEKAIDALVTLRTNLRQTGMLMDEITAGRAQFGLLKAKTLSASLSHDMTVLAETFDLIAPARKLQLEGRQPELVSVLLRREANEDQDD